MEEKITTELTTDKLLDIYLDKHLDHQMENDFDKQEELAAELEEFETTLLSKVDNIEHVIVEKNARLATLESQTEYYKNIYQAFLKKTKAVKKASDDLESLIIAVVDNVGKQDGTKTTLENNGFRYTSYESPGSLNITDLDNVPTEYQKIKVDIDKARLRKDLIANGNTEYANVPRVKRLKVK